MKAKVFAAASITPGAAVAGGSDEFIVKLETAPGYAAENSRLIFNFSTGVVLPDQAANTSKKLSALITGMLELPKLIII